MKTLITPVITLILLLNVYGCNTKNEEAYFSGEVVYSYSYESNTLNTDSLTKERPSQSILRYDMSGYQSQFIGKDTVTYYYSGNLNSCVSQNDSTKEFECEDYGIFTDSVISWKRHPANEKILDQDCDILEIQKKNSFVRYYVSKQNRIAPLTYQKHRSYNWDVYGEKANGGLILRSEHRFKNFTMNGIATSVKNYSVKFKALEMDEKTMTEICNAVQSAESKK